MNKKGFVLMETIVVIVVISVALLTLFTSYNKILSKVKSENTSDNPEYVYMTHYVREHLKSASLCTIDIFSMETGGTLNNYANIPNCISNNLKNTYNIKNVYLINNVSNTNSTYLSKFDPYVIDYIRALDVSTDDVMLIVEFYKYDIDEGYNNKLISCFEDNLNSIDSYYCNNSSQTVDNYLKKTYVASLEW